MIIGFLKRCNLSFEGLYIYVQPKWLSMSIYCCISVLLYLYDCQWEGGIRCDAYLCILVLYFLIQGTIY